jgi:cellulose synthase/poly-beta-1,6-N-acetylglucosamine synthase-like glycosyltransferase
MLIQLGQILFWAFLLYFIGLNLGYLTLNVISFLSLSRYMQGHVLDSLPQIYSDFEPPISLIVPAYNEQATIAASIRSLLQLNYPEFEILVVNDGSKDQTLEVLKKEFSLVPFPEAFRVRLKTKAVQTVYQSTVYPELRVIDKQNGGKADALNAGINGSRYPLFCGLDADSVLQRNSLQSIVRPFLEEPKTVACGGVIRIANGCEVSGGFLVHAGLPRNLLALFQIMEYLRAFLFGRLGWSPMNALMVISGAFGLFHKETVIKAGGYRTDTVGEDMELVVRLHKILRAEGAPYRITFIPDPVCWTEAPEDLRTLKNQRVRWQRGLSDSLWMNRELLFNRQGGTVGWLAFPFMVVFEWLSPLIEVAGYIYFVIACFFGLISFHFAFIFLCVAIGFGILLSATALLLEEMSFHTYPKIKHLLLLFVAVIAENFGYRQLVACWRLMGLIHWAGRGEAQWGVMTRKASWQHDSFKSTP